MADPRSFGRIHLGGRHPPLTTKHRAPAQPPAQGYEYDSYFDDYRAEYETAPWPPEEIPHRPLRRRSSEDLPRPSRSPGRNTYQPPPPPPNMVSSRYQPPPNRPYHQRQVSEPQINIIPPEPVASRKSNMPSMHADVPSPASPPPLVSRRMSAAARRLSRPHTPQKSYATYNVEQREPSSSPSSPEEPRDPPFLDDRDLRLQRSQSARGSSSNASNSLTATTNTTTSMVLGFGPYHYTPVGDASIRLIRLLPERKTMIKCKVIHVSLENPPDYVAISYAWGDPGDTRRIELEDCYAYIPVSLYGALQVLRQKSESVLLWVDALSIDQHNREERAQQVQLMPSIYSNAKSVAVYLGPKENNSSAAVEFLQRVAAQADQPDAVSRLLASGAANGDLAAVVSLFERDYWRRLWVVQEVFNAREITVYCGDTKVSWDVYQVASDVFGRHRSHLANLADRVDRRGSAISANQFSFSQVLIYLGPASLPDLDSYTGDRAEALLEILRACRRKLASDPRDKLFAILGVLPEEIRSEFRADYNLSVRDTYADIVDYLLKTTERLDVICEAIHFPVHTSSANLPSFIPDWSHIPQTASMGSKYSFSASGSTKAVCRFLDDRLNKLEFSAIYIDKIATKGITVGTFCNLGDYLMAFLHWRALLLDAFSNEGDKRRLTAEEDFAVTLCLGEIPEPYNQLDEWLSACYNVFANLLRERLPYIPLDQSLRVYLDANTGVKPEERRRFLQNHFGNQMMGRCFCLTSTRLIGMGTGFMLPDDIVVVPLGCSTPILLRAEGIPGEYRYVGDVYLDGYMKGQAVKQWKANKKELKKYVLH